MRDDLPSKDPVRLLTNAKVIKTIIKNIRGGVCQVNTRYERASNPKMMARNKQHRVKRSIVALDYNSKYKLFKITVKCSE